MKKKNTLIGRKYIPNDNSYLLVLSSDLYGQSIVFNRLAGTINSNPVECNIVSEPYFQVVNSYGDDFKEYEFINVSYDNHTYRVLFKESNVDANLLERIKHNHLLNSF